MQKIRDLLAKNDNIAVILRKNPSIDEMAAALSLYLLLRDAKKNVTVACPTEPIVELSNLVGIDKVVSKLEGQEGDLTVSFPYAEGEIEKVSYTLDHGLLNIIVKAAGTGLSFDEKDVRFSKGGGAFSVVFVIGTPVLSDLGEFINSGAIRGSKIVNIDNKQENEGYGDLVVVSPDFSSVSEQVADIVLSLGFNIDRDVAQNLLSGITFATNNFQEESTSPIAFEIASLLMRSGARREVHSPSRSRQPQSRQARGLKYLQDKQLDRQPAGNSRSSQQVEDENAEDDKAPNDWLAPKVYKGSSNF